MDQKTMPIVEMLNGYAQENPVRMHMPGHKGRGQDIPMWAWDVTELPGTDDLALPEGKIAEAQMLAARAFGAKNTFFLVNGSSVGCIAMVLSCAKPGEKAIFARDAHKAACAAMVLGGIEPVFIPIPIEEGTGMPGGVLPEDVQAAVNQHPDAKSVYVTAPNYYGGCADIGEIARITHRAGMKLIVDAAQGAHFSFSDQLPLSPGQAGADLWVQSAHKTLPALGQTALLHLAHEEDAPQVRRMTNMLQTSSPSYLLMASLDQARYWMAAEGEAAIGRLIEECLVFKRRIHALPGLYCVEMKGRYGVVEQDPTRITIDVSGRNLSGMQAQEQLRSMGVQVEMADVRRVVLLCSINNIKEDFEKTAQAFERLKPGKKMNMHDLFLAYQPLPEKKWSPRQAVCGIIKEIQLEQACGSVAAQAVGVYPPGIPLCYPGEVIREQDIRTLMQAEAYGLNCFGVTRQGKIEVVDEDAEGGPVPTGI